MTIKALLAAAVVALVVMGLVTPPASAHTAMLRASPDRDATAGGSVRFIDLQFLDPVADASVTVTYNGAPVPGRTTVAAGEVITFALDQSLTEPGRYQVSFEMISADSDFTTGAFFFTFDPAADQAARIEPSGSGGFSTPVLVSSGVGLAVVVVLLGLFVSRISNRRRDQFAEVTTDYDSWDDW